MQLKIFEPQYEKACFYIYKNKDTDQFCTDDTADQHLCFLLFDSTTLLLVKSSIPSIFIYCTGWLWFVVDQVRNDPKRRSSRVMAYFVFLMFQYYTSRIVRKPDFCLGENKGADQLRGNREADQRLCFRYWDSIIPLLLIAKISSI